MADPDEAAWGFMQQTIDICRQTVAAKIAGLD